MRPLARWCPALACLLVFVLVAVPVWAQGDSTAAGGLPTTAGAFGITYLLSNIVPEIGAYVTKKLNLGYGWYAKLGNEMKMVVYVLGTMAVMLAFQLVGLVFDPNVNDVRSLTTPAITNFVHALLVTVMVKLGISSAKAKAKAAPLGSVRPRP